MSPVAAVSLVAVGMSAVMVLLWLESLRRHEADIVDLGWTAGLGAAALFHAAALAGGAPERRWLVAGMAAIWSGRLALHLLRRVREPGEDGRYRTLRAKWGSAARARFFVFFQAQGILVAALSIHFALAMLASDAPLRATDGLAVAVWLLAIGGEAVADRQLARFRADPANRGTVCRTGLWGLSRHPNYFFEWLHWLAYVPFAFGTAAWPWLLIAPAVMLFFILFVTGIPPTEAQALKSRGEAYREYQRTTSAFVPWFPLGRTR